MTHTLRLNQQTAKTSLGETKSIALGLMLTVALCRGSLFDTLSVAQELLQSAAGGDGLACLPPSALTMLAELKKIRMRSELSCPDSWWSCKYFNASSLPSPLSSGSGGNGTTPSQGDNHHAPTASTIATDGVTLFVWDTEAKALVSMGSGLHGSIQGTYGSAYCGVYGGACFVTCFSRSTYFVQPSTQPTNPCHPLLSSIISSLTLTLYHQLCLP